MTAGQRTPDPVAIPGQALPDSRGVRAADVPEPAVR